jgi:serine phosphatase RsbU (regulator of sigma subunit)
VQHRVLFVDDDPRVLAGVRRQLRKKVPIETAESGRAGLEALSAMGPFSVVVTDYCMPEMNGIEFLTRVRQTAPETVRMLLTGSADLQAAIQAVNQGNVYRFLTKPCSPEALVEALDAGIKHYHRTRRERKFNQRTRHWLNQAMEVQQNLMPRSVPDLEGVDLCGRSIYCDDTGGDYYDYFVKPSEYGRKLDLVVGDVSDHGLPSALLMTTARGFLREAVNWPGSVASVVESVNRQLTRDVQANGRFMTLFFLEIDLQTRSLRWVRAGHEPALLYEPRTGEFEELRGQGGLPLGVLEDCVYEENIRDMVPGQVIAIGTDGIWGARNAEGCMFGKQVLKQVINENAARPAAEIVHRVLEALKQFMLPLELDDDATLIIAKVGC